MFDIENNVRAAQFTKLSSAVLVRVDEQAPIKSSEAEPGMDYIQAAVKELSRWHGRACFSGGDDGVPDYFFTHADHDGITMSLEIADCNQDDTLLFASF